MATVNDALVVRLEANIKGLQSSLDTANRNIAAFSKKADSDLGMVESALKRGATAALSLAAVWGSIKMGESIVDAGVQMQALTYRMNAAVGSAAAAKDAMAYVREESDRLGLSFTTAAEGFAGFAASSLRSGMTLDQTKKVFTGVAEAVTAMHLPADRAASAFLAIEQMASKTTVQMQELKLQLGQAIPGSMEMMAQAMGISNQKMNEMMAKGELLARDALPALAKAFHEQFADQAEDAANGAQAAFNRFGNALFNLEIKFANSGFLDAVVDSVKRLTDALNDPGLQKGLAAFATFLGTVIEMAARAAAAVGNFMMKIGELEVKAASLVGIGPGVKTPAPGAKPASSAQSSDVFGNYSLGGGPLPGELSAAQLEEQKRRQRQREQLANRVASINQTNARETDPAKAAALEYAAQQKELDKALKIKAISEQQYRDASLQAEIAYQDRLTDVRKKANDLEKGMREKTLDSIAGMLQVFAGKNKAIAIAMLAFDKARAIAQTIIETHVAAVAALKYDPTGATSARITAYGYANVAAIAATGIAQLATMGVNGGSSGGGGSDVSSPSSSSDSGSASSSAKTGPSTVYVDFRGKTIFSQNDLRNLIEQLNEASGDGFKIVTSS